MSTFVNQPTLVDLTTRSATFVNQPIEEVSTSRAASTFVNALVEVVAGISRPASTFINQNPETVLFPVVFNSLVTDDAVKYRLLIFDNTGNLVGVLRPLGFSFADIVNGGSEQGTFEMPVRFVDNGWYRAGYRVQFFLRDSKDPWYDGRIMEDDPEQQDQDQESITIHTEGWQTHLDDAIVSEVLSPGVQPNGVNNGDMNADQYLNHLLNTYQDNDVFGSYHIPSMPISLSDLTFDGQGLGRCVDDVIKQVLDNTGNEFEWWVRGVFGGKPAVVIQPQSNPNKVTQNYISPTEIVNTYFIDEYEGSTIYEYKLQNNYRNLYNMIALYGGQDPNTQEQIYGPFKDSTSISLYGLRQKKVTNQSLLSQQSLQNYATVYLLLNAYPQPQGSFKKVVGIDGARSGQWFQIWERGLQGTGESYIQPDGVSVLPTFPQRIKQVRAVKVVTSMQQGTDRIEQMVYTTAPRPFIDYASYNAILSSANKQAAQQSRKSRSQLVTYFVSDGFGWVG